MFGSKNEMNFYEVLEVAPDAPQNEIHKAYQRAKATYSQDNPALYSMFTREEARDLLRLIEEAYSILGNHALRRSYDEGLMQSAKRAGISAQRSFESPVQAPQPGLETNHDMLPDFVVPDPSIPGSFENQSPQQFQPTAPPPAQIRPPMQMETVHSASAGTRESVLISSDDFTVRKRESSTTPAPGMGRCPLSTYKIDENIEREIADRVEFDGPFLQKVRLYKQVPMEKLSVASRIGKTYLIALESNDFKNLPAPVFLRGFLVQVGRQLGLDENKVVTSYLKLAKATGK